MKRILFLDIDGVVNCAKTAQRHRGVIGIDPYMAFKVGQIVLETGCEIVLSSTWRLGKESREEVARQVYPFIDITPNLWTPKEKKVRGDEIQDWLNRHPEVEKYAILDDDSDMLPEQLPNFFQTTWAEGITDEIQKKVIEHLTNY